MPVTVHLPRYPLAFLPTPLHPLSRLGIPARPKPGPMILR